MSAIARSAGPSNKPLHQTRRGGVLASRAVVEARLAGERRCSTDHAENEVFRKALRPANLFCRVAAIISRANIYGNILAAPAGLAQTCTGSLWRGNRYRLGMRGVAHNSRLSNNALHQTRRRGVAAARPVVVGRLAGEREC